MVILWWAVASTLVILFQEAMCYVEIMEETGFENTTFRLQCIHLDSIIVIYDATYQPFENNSTLEEIKSCNPRSALNQRCSGVGHCSFILNQDCIGADEWGPGNFKIKYACISDEERLKYCNQDIILPNKEENRSSEGFVHNPGYPRFYLGSQDCQWTIRASSSQKIKVTILDLSLLGNSETCQDLLVIKDSNQTVFRSCLQKETPIEITSSSDTLEIYLSTSEKLTPRRGVLFHYTAVGCPTPETPQDGYLMFRNDSVAMFSCCAGYTFADSCEKTKVLTCTGYKWDKPLLECDNKSKSELAIPKELINKPVKLNEDNMSELIAPIVLIIALFAINAVVLFFIIRYRRRKAAEPTCTEEELKTFSVTTNGNNQMA